MLKQLQKLIILSGIVFFILPNLASAATYYIDATNGNDSNGGTSTAAPWQKISKVNASTFQPGDNTFQLCPFAPQGLGLIRFVPNIGILELAIDLLEALFLYRIVKDTP